LIVGAGFLQSFVIQKAKEIGYEVYAVDANPNALGFRYADRYAVINIVDEQACLAYAKENRIDGVLTAATEYGVLTTAYIAKELGLPGISYETAKLIKNKYQVTERLLAHNVEDVRQVLEISENTDVEELSQKIKYPTIVKPRDGSGSRGIRRVNKAEELIGACEYARKCSSSDCLVIESFIEGKEYGAESLVINGEVYVLGIMKKWMTEPPYYAELGHSLPNDLSPDTQKKAKKCVADAIKVLGIDHGSVNMDLLISEDGKVHIVDVGARMGGNMIGPCIIAYGTGIDYMKAMIQIAVGDKVDLKPNKSCAVATKIMAFDEGIVENIPDTKETETAFGVEIYHHLAVGMKVNEYHTNLDGCGYIVAKADTYEEAVLKAERTLRFYKQTIFKSTEK